MHRLLLAFAAALLLLRPALADPAAPCAPRTFEGSRFTVCTLDLARHDIRLFWRDEGGLAYGALARIPDTLDDAPLVMAMNAGMYHHDLSPVGLHVEGGERLSRASTREGPGNFHLKPNGVFFIEGERAGVLETGAFLERAPRARLATQSGPMLVIDGRLHPRFREGSDSLKRRNGVGVRDDGRTVVFAISEGLVNFHRFARLFRDELGTRDALFLDGSISSLRAPHLGRSDFRRPLGPILGVYARR